MINPIFDEDEELLLTDIRSNKLIDEWQVSYSVNKNNVIDISNENILVRNSLIMKLSELGFGIKETKNDDERKLSITNL